MSQTLFESIYLEDNFEAYVDILNSKIYINTDCHTLKYRASKIFYRENNVLILGTAVGIVSYNFMTKVEKIEIEHRIKGFRSNDGYFDGENFYLGYMNTLYDTQSNYYDEVGYVVLLSKNGSELLSSQTGIPNFMFKKDDVLHVIDSLKKSINKITSDYKVVFESKYVLDGGCKYENSYLICCYDSKNIVKIDLDLQKEESIFEDLPENPTSCNIINKQLVVTCKREIYRINL